MNTFRLDQAIFVALIVLITAVFPILDASIFGTRMLIPLAVLYVFSRRLYGLQLLVKPPLIYFVALIIWSTVPNLLADAGELAWNTYVRMLVVLAYIYVISIFVATSESSSIAALRAFAVSSVIILLNFLLTPQNIDYTHNLEREYELNANTYGYYSFIGMSSLLLLLKYGRITPLRVLVLIGVGVMSCLVQIMTASRGGFIISAAFLIAAVWTLLRYKIRNNVIRIFTLIFVLTVATLVGIKLASFFQDSLLFDRFTLLEGGELSRAWHVEEAWRLALNSPVFGIGGGNYAVQPRFFEPGAFTHNGFLEAFVSFGVAGLALYALMYVEYFSALWRARKNSNVDGFTFTVHVLFLVGLLAYNFLYVPYLTMEFLPLFAIFRISLSKKDLQKFAQ